MGDGEADDRKEINVAEGTDKSRRGRGEITVEAEGKLARRIGSKRRK